MNSFPISGYILSETSDVNVIFITFGIVQFIGGILCFMAYSMKRNENKNWKDSILTINTAFAPNITHSRCIQDKVNVKEEQM